MARIRTIRMFGWTFERRFMRRVSRELTSHGECWRWTGAMMRNGYGQLGVGGKHFAAHRYCYEHYRGQIPPGLDLDHLCRNRWCVNPDHLEPVTRSENLKRGIKRGEHNRAKTHCPQGHPFSGNNLYIHPSGRRCCRRCAADRSYARRHGAH